MVSVTYDREEVTFAFYKTPVMDEYRIIIQKTECKIKISLITRTIKHRCEDQ